MSTAGNTTSSTAKKTSVPAPEAVEVNHHIHPDGSIHEGPNSTTFNFDDDIHAVDRLVARNAAWVEKTNRDRPALFTALANTQRPLILWFGCSDSRVPETSLLDLLPGEVFVHRNIANVLPYNDLNSLSVLQYAVEVLKVKHVVVCGHYGCGGVAAALGNKKLGVIDLWLKNIRIIRAQHAKELDAIPDPVDRQRRLVELNTVSQVHSVMRNSNVIEAMRTRGMTVDALVYDVASGRIKKLEVPADKDEAVFDLQY